MEKAPHDNRFSRIERKLSLLLVISIVQTVVIGLLVIGLFIRQFMPGTLTLILMAAAVAVFLFAFRSQIPSWFGNSSRFVFSKLGEAKKSDSIKENL